VQIADHKLDRDDALGILQEYAVNYAGTVRFYDLAGDPGGHPGPGVTPARPMPSPSAISAVLSS
jgi:hypothetical protein